MPLPLPRAGVDGVTLLASMICRATSAFAVVLTGCASDVFPRHGAAADTTDATGIIDATAPDITADAPPHDVTADTAAFVEERAPHTLPSLPSSP